MNWLKNKFYDILESIEDGMIQIYSISILIKLKRR